MTNDFDRRLFLKGAGLTLTGFGLSSLLPTPLMQHAFASTLGAKKVMFLFLRGGNDALNTVIPHGDADYNVANRPSLYIAPNDAIDLNGFVSLNPNLSDLMPVFNAGDLAVVHRVGYPNMSRSHFDGQRIWENGDPTKPLLFEGWLQRYIREHIDDGFGRFPAVGSPGAGTLVTGAETYKTDILNPDNFNYGFYNDQQLKRDKFRALWTDQAQHLSSQGAYRTILSETELKLQDALDEYATWDQINWHPQDPNSGDYLFPVDATTDPSLRFQPYWEFFKNLKVCALALLESDATSLNGTRIAGSQIDGFDTHNGQGVSTGLDGLHARLLEAVGYGIHSLYVALSGTATNEPRNYPSIWADTALITLSEFGRTTLENGSIGTDHGNATAIFVGGGGVSGGVYNASSDPNDWPTGVMFGDEGRDLLEKTDFRAIFWEMLRDHMGAQATSVETIFPGYTAGGLSGQELGLFT